jgi:hypothetical protein
VAAEGYRLVRQILLDASQETGDFRDVGVAYVTFARTHRAHFEVMYRPELYHAGDSSLVEARDAAAATLYGPTTEPTGEATSGASPASLPGPSCTDSPRCGSTATSTTSSKANPRKRHVR